MNECVNERNEQICSRKECSSKARESLPKTFKSASRSSLDYILLRKTTSHKAAKVSGCFIGKFGPVEQDQRKAMDVFVFAIREKRQSHRVPPSRNSYLLVRDRIPS